MDIVWERDKRIMSCQGRWGWLSNAKDKADLEVKVSKLEASVLAAIPPFYFTLHNCTHSKKHGLKWRSPLFYWHPWGYKVSVEVVAGGSSVGEGSHVSVHVHVLRGEYDSQLRFNGRFVAASHSSCSMREESGDILRRRLCLLKIRLWSTPGGLGRRERGVRGGVTVLDLELQA